jgi:hypothetical protein
MTVQRSAVSGKEQGTFDTMMMMYTLYNHQLYQGKNKVHSILWLWCTLCTIISYIRERQLMIVQSVHHNHSIECTLFFPWYSWWMYKVYIIIIVSNVPCSFPDIADYNHQLYQGKNKVHSILWLWCTLCTIISYIRERTRYIRYYDDDVHFVHSSAIVQSVHHNHSIECTLFFPWYSWWLYKVYITIIVSNVPCSFPDTADDWSGKEQGTFDTMMMMYTLYNHQLYQGKNKVHSILWLRCPLKVYIIIIVSNVPCSFPDTADDCTKCTSQS